MRIISGSAKGRKLFTPPTGNKTIRPTSDRAREALFSILGSRVINATVLDLFAGTGAFGCEALSREARLVTFLDHSRTALRLIHKNIALVPGGRERATIVWHDMRNGFSMKTLQNNNLQQFDLIFADPPYELGFSEKTLQYIDNNSVLSKKGLVIIEEKKNVILNSSLHRLVHQDLRHYGDTTFHIFSTKN